MSLDELTEKSTIEFEEYLTLEQTDELLKYLARELPAHINYTTEETKNLYLCHGEKEIKSETTKIKLTGTISPEIIKSVVNVPNYLIETYSLSSVFTCESDYFQEEEKIKTLKFDLIPGKDLEEYDKEELKFWNAVREKVKKYFEQRKN